MPRKWKPPSKWHARYYEERDSLRQAHGTTPPTSDKQFDQEFAAEFDPALDADCDEEPDPEIVADINAEIDRAIAGEHGVYDDPRVLSAKVYGAVLERIQSRRAQRAAESGMPGPVTPEQASHEPSSAKQPVATQPSPERSAAERSLSEQAARVQGAGDHLAPAPDSTGLSADSQPAVGDNPVAGAPPESPGLSANDQSDQPALKQGERCGPRYIVTPPSPSGIVQFIMLDDEPGDDTAASTDSQPTESGAPPPASAAATEAQSASNAAAPLAPFEGRSVNVPTPYWLPDGADFDAWPANLKRAVVHVINPAYDELVIRAPSAMAKIAGLSVVQLVWLGVIEHIKLARLDHGCELPDPEDPLGVCLLADQITRQQGETREQIIERILRLANVKLKACNFLARLQEFKAQWPRIETFSPPSGLTHSGG